ncbi:MAG TPA: DUF1269 domain-containing protein [Candidatus Bathyarchaeia archaeon]|nr:DUF1269 domain-containing protein [Candidatus Bathyarchaeia archaeon]
MNKMLVLAFNSQEDAHKGLDALNALDSNGDITLYATAILTKDNKGDVELLKEADEGPVGTTIGMLSGSLIGLLGGPTGAVAGMSIGGMTGLLADMWHSGVSLDFLDEISELLVPGKTVVLAEADEDWVVPVNEAAKQLGGNVFRRARKDVIEDQLAQESAVLDEEAREIHNELKKDTGEAKAAAKQTLESIKNRVRTISETIDSNLEHANDETKAKVKTLQEKMKKASKERRVKYEKQIAHIKENQKIRNEKLKKARQLTKEALAM